MGAPQNHDRFPETMELLNQAIESERGIAVRYPNARKAFGARMRMYTKINDSRKESKLIFPEDHPMWGRTPFDCLELQLDPPFNKKEPDVPTKILIRKIDPGYYQLHGIEIEEL